MENEVLRTVFLPKELDNKLRNLAFKLAITKGDLILLLVKEGIEKREEETNAVS